ncbi:MAG: hypothetical protein DCC57_24340 [Chloroflexi bacterium]|nr:MAG: hypothetical protein DCC57_24340 [Chloroflexota bacterium]
MKLKAVVIGAGWAGEGHTNALRSCGVEVAAICARQQDVVQDVANRLNVPEASTDWRQTLATIRPEIVALATPASLRHEVVEVATALGCHLFCDKPLAATAAEAKELLRLVTQTGVKHAYTATQAYDPSVGWAAELLRNEVIGPLVEVDCIFRLPYAHPLQPWSWFDNLATGGGLLNNGATHIFAMLERMLDRKLVRVAGRARVQRRRAPVAAPIHDFRQISASIPTEAEAAAMEWRTCNADDALSALLEFAPSDDSRSTIPVSLLINLAAPTPAATNGWHFFGEQGTLFGDGVFSIAIRRQAEPEAEATLMPVPQRYIDELPQIGDDVQNKWAALARDFAADIRGEPHRPYLTFYDGWRYQEAIDAIRSGGGWCELPVLT